MRHLLVVLLILFISCRDDTSSTQNTDTISKTLIKLHTSNSSSADKKYWIDRLNGKRYLLPDTIAGKPAIYYLRSSEVSPLAKAFYLSEFRPEDNDSTTELLKLVTTGNKNVRPFYRWCLDLTIQISDGALGEYPGRPALNYAVKFPTEFFRYMDQDSSKKRYKQWTEIIAYSGLNDYSKTDVEIEDEIRNRMYSNCSNCNDNTKTRIISFAQDVAKAVHLQD